jgi:BA14K-like protein
LKGENDMKKLMKTVTLSLAVLATVITSSVPASAGEFYHRRHHGDNNGGDALAAGAVGLIAGALIGGALAQPQRHQRVYIDPPVYPQADYGDNSYGEPDPYYTRPRQVYVDPYNNDGYYQQPRVIIRQQVYQPRVRTWIPPRQRIIATDSYSSLQPWSPEWFDYCSTRYRTFNPHTGTFRGRYGRTYFCTAG